MAARRSSQCTHGHHAQCVKLNGSDCPCNCHSQHITSLGLNSQSEYIRGTYACYYKQHQNCYDGTCECDCHGRNTVIPQPVMQPAYLVNTTGVTANGTTYPSAKLDNPEQSQVGNTLSPVNSKVNYQHTVARLAPIAKAIREQFFLGEDINFEIVGSTVRDALFGSLVEDYKLIVNAEIIKPFVLKYLESVKVDSKYKLTTKFGDILVDFLSWRDGSVDVYQPNWSCDAYKYSIDRGITKTSDRCQTLERDGVLFLINKTIAEPKLVLEEGVNLAQKYGWTLDQESIQFLAKEIQRNAPLVNTHELVVGFRAYNTNQGYLQGMAGKQWYNQEMTVDCPDFKQHVGNVDSDWRSRGAGNYSGDGQHDCGIYVYKDPSEALFHYGVKGGEKAAMAIVYCWGVIGEFEKGYRVEHCEIQRLWIWDKDIRLNDNYKIREIVSGAKYSDFLYDPQVMQFAARFDEKLENEAP